MAHWVLIGLLALVPQLASAQASVSVRVDDAARTAALSGEYRLYRDPRWTVSTTGALEQPAPGATSLAQGLNAQYGFRLGERPATLSLGYGARRDWLGANGLDAGQSGTIDLGWQPNPLAGVGAFASLTRMNFDLDGANARLDSQDGATSRAGVRGTLAFDYRRQTLQGTLAYVKSNAEGANFVSRGPAAGLQYTHLLGRLWSLVAGVDYTKTRYTEYAADPARASALYGCRLALQGPLMRRLKASLAYALSRQTWNQDPLVRTETVLLSLTYAL